MSGERVTPPVPKLVAVDGNGTLLQSDGASISDYTRVVIDRMQAGGVPVVLVTGRSYDKAKATLELAGMRQYVITENGARAVKIDSGESLYEFWLDGADVVAPMKRIKEQFPGQCFFVQLTKEGGIIEDAHPWLRDDQQREAASAMFGAGVPDLPSVLENGVLCAKSYVTMLGSSDFPTTMSEVKAAAGDGWDVREIKHLLPGGTPRTCEVQSARVNKAGGLSGLCRALDIPLESVWAFGDDSNDAAMLSQVGWGVRMSNHTHALDTVGRDVTSCSNDADGVAKYLDEHFLSNSGLSS